MTDRPYTDDDLRTEASRLLASASQDADDRVRPAAHRKWHEHGPDAVDQASDSLIGLLDSAADVSEWAVNLGADGLEPSNEHVISIGAGEKPIARIHFAFEPGMPDDMRTSLVEGIGSAIAQHLPQGGQQ